MIAEQHVTYLSHKASLDFLKLLSSFSEPMDMKTLATLRTELELLLDTGDAIMGLEGKVAVGAQRETQRHKEGEVTLQKIREEVESVMRLCEDHTKELTEHHRRINEQFQKIAQRQDEIQQELQLWDAELRHKTARRARLATECKFQYFQHFIIPKSRSRLAS